MQCNPPTIHERPTVSVAWTEWQWKILGDAAWFVVRPEALSEAGRGICQQCGGCVVLGYCSRCGCPMLLQ